MKLRMLVVAAIVAPALCACGLAPDPPLVPLARTCGQWQELALDEQLTTAEALVADRLEVAREQQLLPGTATREEIVAAVNGSIGKVCELSRQPAMPLTEVIADLYG